MKRFATMLFTLLVLCSATASAQQAADFERDVLRSIDTVPTRAQLDASFPDARARLEAAALRTSGSTHVRHRAMTLLSLYPDARTRAFLGQLLEDEEPEMRRMAVYTLGRTYGANADQGLVALIGAVIASDESTEVVEWAVRSLRWVHHDDAHRLLSDIAASDGEHAKLAALALRRSTYLPEASTR